MRLSNSCNPTDIWPKVLQARIPEVPSPRLNLWIPDIYKAFPPACHGAEVSRTNKYIQKMMIFGVRMAYPNQILSTIFFLLFNNFQRLTPEVSGLCEGFELFDSKILFWKAH